MALLSSQLYDLAKSASDAPLDHHKRPCFFWIWYWLFINQPAQVLHQELDDLAALLNTPFDPPHLILELAWKAEALEFLLQAK